MLLSAVVTRIFGVKKVQDERSPENKTTAKEFFTRFPTLRKFILMKLEDAVTAISDSQRYLTSGRSLLIIFMNERSLVVVFFFVTIIYFIFIYLLFLLVRSESLF